MKFKREIGFLTIIFVLLTSAVKLCPEITFRDKVFIVWIQTFFEAVPTIVFLLPDCVMYSIMLALPLVAGAACFIRRKEFLRAACFSALPAVTFGINCVVKTLVARQRPPFDLQPLIHPHSFSYVSSHSLVTFCVWTVGLIYLNRFCPSLKIKTFFNFFGTAWILFTGLSRVMLGVHYPSDVLAAWVLGSLIFLIYLNIDEKLPNVEKTLKILFNRGS